MKLIFIGFFFFLAHGSFGQTIEAVSKEQMDSLLCPKGFAAIGQPYLEFKVTNEKRTIDHQSLKGKVVLINFWFEACPPCIAEMEALNELYLKMKDNKDFVFLSITYDNIEIIKRVKEKYGLAFEAFSTSLKEAQRLNFGCGYPTNLIIDRSGILKYRHIGAPPVKEEAREFVMKTLKSEIESLF